MRNLYLTLAFIASSGLLNAQAPGWQWATSAGGFASDVGNRVVAGASGKSYITGTFGDTAMFGAVELKARDNADIYVAAKTEAGWDWVRALGSTGFDQSADVGADASGSVYVAGTTGSDSISLQTGSGDTTIYATAEINLLLCKYSSSGDLLWARTAPIDGGGRVGAIAVRPLGSVLVTGSFTETIAFGATSIESEGGHDIFVAEFTPEGNLLRLQGAGGPGDDEGSDIALDPSGNYYTTGLIAAGTVSFGEMDVNVTEGAANLFLAKYGVGGEPLWVKNDGSSPFNLSATGQIAVDRSGNCYMIGWFFFSISIGGRQITSQGEVDGFVQKYRADGTFEWVDHIGGVMIDMPTDIAVDRDGNAYVTGLSQTLPDGQVFVMKYNPDKRRGWLATDRASGSMSSMTSGGIAVGEDGALYICGSFSGTVAFGSTLMTAVGSTPSSSSGTDLFIARLGNVAGIETPHDAAAPGLALDPPVRRADGISITYRAPASSQATVSLHDARGAEVMTLDRNHAGDRERSILLDHVGLHSGIYYIVLRSNGMILSRQLTIVH